MLLELISVWVFKKILTVYFVFLGKKIPKNDLVRLFFEGFKNYNISSNCVFIFVHIIKV